MGSLYDAVVSKEVDVVEFCGEEQANIAKFGKDGNRINYGVLSVSSVERTKFN